MTANADIAITLAPVEASGNFYSPRPTFNQFMPTVDDAYRMFLLLLPKGRALGTHDLSITVADSPIKQFFYALATEWITLERMAIEMVDEGFCVYARQDVDGWMADYVLPDEADIYEGHVCEKVTQLGALTIDEYREIAERMGWVVLDIRFLKGTDGEFPGVYATLFIRTSLESPIVPQPEPLGDFVLGTSPVGTLGDEPADRLRGLYDRSLPAHVAIQVEVV